MAYFRDDCYLFDTDDHFHIWVRGGYDSWQESTWAVASKNPQLDAGVQVPIATMDRFVLMRLAEMVCERTAVATLEQMAETFSRPGNTGENCLRQNYDPVRDALRQLDAKCAPRQREDSN